METAERVKQIHGAVDKASEVLLQDMPYDIGNIQALKRLGFSNAGNVADFEDHQGNKEFARYYQDKYPMYKFITEHQLKKVREKFGLMEGRLDRFVGDIPDRNITEMLQLKIQRGDIRKSEAFSSWREIEIASDFGLHGSVYTVGLNSEGLPSIRDLSRIMKPSRVEMFNDRAYGIPSWQDGFKMDASRRDTKREEFLAKAAEEHRMSERRVMNFAELNDEFPGSITITADKNLFKAPDPDLDPIVTVAVKGGYLVVTAWGAEASDPDVANPKMN